MLAFLAAPAGGEIVLLGSANADPFGALVGDSLSYDFMGIIGYTSCIATSSCRRVLVGEGELEGCHLHSKRVFGSL
jgi:hypothetical protein